jgi:hypothetical protein
MAKFLSQVYTQIRGSVGGITYLTTPAGSMIARARNKPVNAPSPYRTFIKSAMTLAVSQWQALTTAQRGAWNTWALANPPGSGREQFIAAMSLIAFGDNSVPTGWPSPMIYIPQPPDHAGHPSITLLPGTFATPLLTGVTFKVRNTSARPVILLCELSTGLSQARNFWKGPWDSPMTQAAVAAAGVVHTFDFIVPAAGMRHFARARSVNNGTVIGQVGRTLSPALITWSLSVTNP